MRNMRVIKIITMMKEFNISVLVNKMKTTLFMIAIKICLWIITIVKPF